MHSFVSYFGLWSEFLKILIKITTKNVLVNFQEYMRDYWKIIILSKLNIVIDVELIIDVELCKRLRSSGKKKLYLAKKVIKKMN